MTDFLIIFSIISACYFYDLTRFSFSIHQYILILNEFRESVLKDVSDRKKAAILLWLSFKQFRLTFLILIKFLLINLPVVLTFLYLTQIEHLPLNYFIQYKVLFETILSVAIYYIFRKYVRI